MKQEAPDRPDSPYTAPRTDVGDKSQSSTKKRRGMTIIFVSFSLLLTLYIFGLTVWSTSRIPFNTLYGKLAFVGLFVGFPAYVYARLSRSIAVAMLAASIAMWTVGLSVLTDLVSALSR